MCNCLSNPHVTSTVWDAPPPFWTGPQRSDYEAQLNILIFLILPTEFQTRAPSIFLLSPLKTGACYAGLVIAKNVNNQNKQSFNDQIVVTGSFYFPTNIYRGNKLNTVLNGGEMLLDTDWIRLADQVSEEWADHLTETLGLIGSTQKESARLSGEVENPVDVEDVFKNTVKWLSATTNSIDNEDAKIVERVSNAFQMFDLFYCQTV